MQMREFTARALFLVLIMTVILGAANAYLGLHAGITIAATYPAAVIGMAVLRTMNGSVLEENIARTAGSIGESVAAGAIFTLPAFLISGAWPSFAPKDAYWKIPIFRFPNPWPRRKFTRPDAEARTRRSICSTTWGSVH